jgi:hypothetical protein
MPETPPEPPVETPPQPPPNLEWRKGLSNSERARIEMGRLLAMYGDELRGFIVDDDAYKLIDKLAVMLDAKG